MVGKVTDRSWTMEVQDRGSPHIHLVFWTEKTSEQLVQMDDLISCCLPDLDHDRKLYVLIVSRQV